MLKPSEINFAGHPDAETYLALAKIARPQKAWSTSGRIFIGLSVPLAVGLLIAIGIPALQAIWFFIPILFLIGMISLLPTFARKLIDQKMKRSYSAAMQKLTRTGTISSKGIHIHFPEGQTELVWSYFDHIVEINGAIGLCKGRDLVDAITRSMFATDQAWSDARNIVLENMSGAARGSKFTS